MTVPLSVRVKVRTNPYDYMLTDTELTDLLAALGRARAESIQRHHEAPGPRGHYKRDCMAFILLDPTAPTWLPDPRAVLAALTIGADGPRFLANAAAKAAGHRRLGRNYGEAVLVDPHLCGTGGFRHGHSAEVRGLIVGASSQTTDQDLYEAGRLATDFIDAIARHHLAWETRTGPGYWVGTEPPQATLDMISFFPED
ncbi:hypothetical protein [Actinokineospora enzanensis]|uniref:hypothetical protein n=1 Tax=Actinokineospora enzanensis TaxID=155975 RepID=UPI000363168D|nr:hypothetical protein [Actinokineospora enzanensis]